MTYYGLSVLSWLGLVHDLRPFPVNLRSAPGPDLPGPDLEGGLP
jgi:hypothetical protein